MRKKAVRADFSAYVVPRGCDPYALDFTLQGVRYVPVQARWTDDDPHWCSWAFARDVTWGVPVLLMEQLLEEGFAGDQDIQFRRASYPKAAWATLRLSSPDGLAHLWFKVDDLKDLLHKIHAGLRASSAPQVIAPIDHLIEQLLADA
jgi:hypothetical protein